MTGPDFWQLLALVIVLAIILVVSLALLTLPFIFVGVPLCCLIYTAAYELIMTNGQTASA